MVTLFLLSIGHTHFQNLSSGLRIILLYLLQTQDLRVDQEKKPCIRVNIRELNRELCTGLSILYINT